jgi:hypothetical protein
MWGSLGGAKNTPIKEKIDKNIDKMNFGMI